LPQLLGLAFQVAGIGRCQRGAGDGRMSAIAAPYAVCVPVDWPGEGLIGGFLAMPAPEMEWFAVDSMGVGRVQTGRGLVLSAIGGGSKTTMQYHFGIAGVIGRVPWGWTIPKTGSSALFLCEDTEANVHRKLDSMKAGLNLSADEIRLLGQRMRVFPLAGKESRLLESDGRGPLFETNLVDALLHAVSLLPRPVVFIGLDPALALTSGDEINPAHQRRLGELVDNIAIETGACVVLATHAAKGLQASDEIGSHTSRGSGAITDAVRGEFVLRGMTAQEGRQFGIVDIAERRAYVQLAATKGNELPPAAFAPLWLRRGPGGVLLPAELEPQQTNAVGRRELSALDILRDLATTAAPSLKTWRDACGAAGLISGTTEQAKEKAMQRIKDTLAEARLIERGIQRGIYMPAEVEEAA